MQVFPPCAGVIGRPGAQENWLNSIPPAYGGYRFPALRRWWSPRIPPAFGGYWPVRILRNRCRAYSPRLRGLSVTHCDQDSLQTVFPPHAVVIGMVTGSAPAWRSITPVCGGYRSPSPKGMMQDWYSPRLRGLSGHEREPLRECGVFPQHAGVST